MKDHTPQWPVERMAEMLDVSTSGYYDWLHRIPTARDERKLRLHTSVAAVYQETHGIYGSRKIAQELAHRPELANACRNTVASAMQDLNLKSVAQKKKRFVSTTDSRHLLPVAENLLDRQFAAESPNQKWGVDITYLPTREGWLYLAVVLDLCSRKLVGWAFSDSLATDLVVQALDMAVQLRCPGPGLLHHSDRGCQYASERYRTLLQSHGITCSMSRKGNCWDNAPTERVFNAVKNEWTIHHDYATHQEARMSVVNYITVFYNPKRRHESLGYKSPDQFEAEYARPHAA